MPDLRSLAILAALVLAALGATWALTSSAMRAWDQVQVLEQQLGDVQRMLDAVTAERAAAEVRARIAESGRQSIISAPAAEDAPVAPILRRALDAADELGGINP